MVTDMDDKLFKELIFNYDNGDNSPLLVNKDTIIEFWMSWCPHCQAMIPRYEKVSEMFPDVACYRVELNQHPELGKLLGVDSFPTFVFFVPGKEPQKWVGEVPTEELAGMVEKEFSVKPK